MRLSSLFALVVRVRGANAATVGRRVIATSEVRRSPRTGAFPAKTPPGRQSAQGGGMRLEVIVDSFWPCRSAEAIGAGRGHAAGGTDILMRLFILFASVLCAQAAIVDGIAATVGRSVITDSMVRRSLRTGAFLAKTPLEETVTLWEENRNRLIEQALVKEEIRVSRYTVAQPDEVRAAMEQVKAQVGGPEAFAVKLRAYRLTEPDLAENLAWQITFSRFITYRFRPAVQVTDQALRDFYTRWKPAGEKPAFEAARDLVETEYIAEESARYLDRWLKEARQQTRIETLQPKGAQP